MRDLDDTDRQILRLLLEDGRRPFSGIAEEVDLSPPAVSDRVDRLQSLGVIDRFTVDLDRSKLSEGVPVLLDLTVDPGSAGEIRAAIADLDWVEHVFETAGARVLCKGIAADRRIAPLVAEAVDLDLIEEYDVHLLAESSWTPTLGDAELVLSCTECGRTVGAEGESLTLDGGRLHFCSESCASEHREEEALTAD
ncbi:AsnC family transcriptional regulator [Salinirubrum litoreum]|uniref:AsnC family transcriptional regulator n=1 Tax=Salinirubrum litoreum TaxID=1126234 RepID=A0ABD5R927_9EURY|nr:AsnC family transcriptional regulator [Salinirubrum litoreum]